MKTDSQIRQKLKQVLFRHLKHRLEHNFKRRPETCTHNGTILYGSDGQLNAPKFCAHAEQLGQVCDVSYGGLEKARACPFWSPEKTKEEVKQEFYLLLSEPKHVLAAEMPDAVALMWVLEEDEITDLPEAEGDPEPLVQIEEPREHKAVEPPPEPDPIPLTNSDEIHPVVIEGDLIVRGDLKVMGQYMTLDKVSRLWTWPGWASRWWPWNWLP